MGPQPEHGTRTPPHRLLLGMARQFTLEAMLVKWGLPPGETTSQTLLATSYAKHRPAAGLGCRASIAGAARAKPRLRILPRKRLSNPRAKCCRCQLHCENEDPMG